MNFELSRLFCVGNVYLLRWRLTNKAIFHYRAPTLPIVVICACNDLCPGGECTREIWPMSKIPIWKPPRSKVVFCSSAHVTRYIKHGVLVDSIWRLSGWLFRKLKIKIITSPPHPSHLLLFTRSPKTNLLVVNRLYRSYTDCGFIDYHR